MRFLACLLASLAFWCQGARAQRVSPSLPFQDSERASSPDRRDVDSLHRQFLLRHPVALALDDVGRRLFVANRRSGTLSVIDTNELTVKFETRVGRTLGDLALLPNRDSIGRGLLAVDEGTHELLLLSLPGPDAWDIQVLDRVAVSRYPVSVTVSSDGRRCFVACLWSRRLDLIGLDPATGPGSLGSLELPFAPREQVVLPGDRLLVADSFGGKLALIDLSRNQVERVLELPAHNIRGLAVTADGSHLLVARQSIAPFARANRDDLVWGGLMSNSLVSLRLSDIYSPTGNMLAAMRTLDLGDFSTPSGDPQTVIVGHNGEVMVAIGGVGRVAIGDHTWPRLDHVKVGRRPRALAAGSDGHLYVANTLSDSISVIDIRSRKPVKELSLGTQAALSQADKGELLFYAATLSLRGWMSCHSCHSDGHSNGLLVDTLGDGNYGAPKRVPSLLGVRDSGPWAWNGGMSALEDQIRKSLRTTLHARDVSEEKVRALATFLRTLQPPQLPAIGSEVSVRRGREVFVSSGCQHCHTPPSYTTKTARDVGLADEVGNRQFNPPSLRGVALRSSFFHDGRARSLREVFEVHRHPDQQISPTKITDLIAFLSTL